MKKLILLFLFIPSICFGGRYFETLFATRSDSEFDAGSYGDSTTYEAGIVKLKKVVPSGLTYWSKLESASDITSPQVGPAGTLENIPTYTAGKFNFGMYCDEEEGFYMPVSGLFTRYVGTIEFWYKPNYNKNDDTFHMLLGTCEIGDFVCWKYGK